MAEKKESYNKAIEKLRGIIHDIESGELDVDVLSESEAIRWRLRMEKLSNMRPTYQQATKYPSGLPTANEKEKF